VTNRPLRPLAIVVLLAFGDYLLWHWSLNANHDILALLAGLTLTPLLIALAWLLVVSFARLFGRIARYSRTGLGTLAKGRGTHPRRSSARTATGRRAGEDHATAQAQRAGGASGTSSSASSSSKLAA
jgi:hypothetical protein